MWPAQGVPGTPGLPTAEGSLEGRPQVDSWHCGGWVCHFVGQQAPSSTSCRLVQQNSKRQMQGGGGRHLLLSLTPDPSLRSSPQPFSLSPSVCRAIKGTSSRRPSFGPVSRLARASHHFQQELKTRHPNRPFLNIARPPTPPDQGWTGQDLLLQTAQTKAPKRAEVLPSRDGLGLGHLRWKCLAKQCLLSSQ